MTAKASGRGVNPLSTVVLLLSCLIGAFLSTQEGLSSEISRQVALVLLGGIGISLLIELRAGLRSMIRVDVFAILAFYFLTFFEFLFPQPSFDLLVIPEDVGVATRLLLAGFAAMVLGRHVPVFPVKWLEPIQAIQTQPGHLLLLFFGAAFLSFLPMLMSVDFNPIAWFDETMKPRFGRAWARGRFGSLSTLLTELQLLGYVMPPLAGVMFARRKDYKLISLFLVGFVLFVHFYSAFSSGTRNILAILIAGFLGGYFIVQPRIKFWQLALFGLVAGGSFFILADHMLQFREYGLGRYIEEKRYTSDFREYQKQYMQDNSMEESDHGYLVDYNLWRLSQMVPAFPELYDYIGWNMPFVAITKPIPRGLWPGKPEGLKVELEDVIGAEGYTIAVTWVGEAFVAGGLPWIVGIGVLIGAFCTFWNSLAQRLESLFPLIVFASGFYAVLLLMRSLMFFTTALLPPIALVVVGFFIYRNSQSGNLPR
jgi:hypothetical protein